MTAVIQKTPHQPEAHHPEDAHALHVEVRVLRPEHPAEPPASLKIGHQATLRDLMQRGAEHFGIEVLPSITEPMDTLHHLGHGGDPGPALADLDETIQEFLSRPGATARFAIRFERIFRVNTRWALSPQPELTPLKILALPQINLNSQDYSLYAMECDEALPPETPVQIRHGSIFEAQKDGKYGGGQQ